MKLGHTLLSHRGARRYCGVVYTPHLTLPGNRPVAAAVARGWVTLAGANLPPAPTAYPSMKPNPLLLVPSSRCKQKNIAHLLETHGPDTPFTRLEDVVTNISWSNEKIRRSSVVPLSEGRWVCTELEEKFSSVQA